MLTFPFPTSFPSSASAAFSGSRLTKRTVSLKEWLRLILWLCLIVTVLTVRCEAQYKGDHIPGFLGLDSGTQAPPGLYVGNVVWIYPPVLSKATASTCPAV